MAEINIERKKKPVWPWILLLVLVAIIGWLVYEYFSGENMAASREVQHTTGMVAHSNTQPSLRFLKEFVTNIT